MSKQKDGLFSIGEIAASLGIIRRIILNYEAKGLVVPDKKEGKTSNRYYTIDTFTRIRTIRSLQNLGLSLDEIDGYLNGTADMNELVARLIRLRDKLNLKIETLQERIASKPGREITRITLPPQTVYVRNRLSSDIADRTVFLRETAYTAMQNYGTVTDKRMYFIEYQPDYPNLLTYCVAVPPESEGEHIRHLPAERALCIYHHGSYETLGQSRKQLLHYAAAKNIHLKRIIRHTYLEGPPQRDNPSGYITQVAALIQ